MARLTTWFVCALILVLFVAEITSLSVPVKKKKITKPVIERPYLLTRDAQAYPLQGGLNEYGYFVDINLGTPPQTFNVLLDSGSSNLYVPFVTCTNATSGAACGQTDRYDPSKSSTAVKLFCNRPNLRQIQCACSSNDCIVSSQYGSGGNWTGYVYNDTFSLTGADALDAVVYIGAYYQVNGFIVSSDIDGILGVGPDILSHNLLPTALTQIAANNSIPDIFGQCYGYASGVLTFGDPDPLYYTGSISYTPITPSAYYSMALTGIQAGTAAVSYTFSNLTTIVDSGTTLIIAPDALYGAIKTAMQAPFCGLPASQQPRGLCPDGNGQSIFWPTTSGTCVYLTGQQLARYPTLVLQVPGNPNFNLSVPPQQYMLNTTEPDCYIFSLQNFTAFGTPLFVLGDAFLVNRYVVTDRASSRIGFATATPRCTAVGNGTNPTTATSSSTTAPSNTTSSATGSLPVSLDLGSSFAGSTVTPSNTTSTSSTSQITVSSSSSSASSPSSASSSSSSSSQVTATLSTSRTSASATVGLGSSSTATSAASILSLSAAIFLVVLFIFN